MRDLNKGSVEVRFTVRSDGSVERPVVLKTSHSGLNKAVLSALAQWKFSPLKHDQEATVEIGFDLR